MNRFGRLWGSRSRLARSKGVVCRETALEDGVLFLPAGLDVKRLEKSIQFNLLAAAVVDVAVSEDDRRKRG